jgi:hypothetical protein
MKKQKYDTTDRPLWPDGIPKKFIKPPFIGLPLIYTSNFKIVKAAPKQAKKK